MDSEEVARLKKNFDGISREVDGESVEYWHARDLQKVLGYAKWERFSGVLARAKESCLATGVAVEDHFADIDKMVPLGSGASRSIRDVMLTRYACYLVAQNGDARKVPVAFAQSYFALQTRKQEMVEERIKLQARLQVRQKLRESESELSRNIYERGVDHRGFGAIRSKGDSALFGGKNTQQMKDQLGVKKGRPLADFLPAITITAKNLANEITNFNVSKDDLQGERDITREHVQNNTSVRELLVTRGIKPEQLPPAEDLKKLERRVRSDEKRLVSDSKFPARLESEGDD